MTQESPKLPKTPAKYYTPSEVRAALERARREATNHNEEYAAGMRMTCAMVEEDLRGDADDDS